MRYLFMVAALCFANACFAGFLPPTVTSVSPTSGPPAGGSAVTVTGTNFIGTSAVHFGATPVVSFTVDSNTQITATSPAGVGTVDVTVTTPGGTSPANQADQFTYTAAPVTLQEFGVN